MENAPSVGVVIETVGAVTSTVNETLSFASFVALSTALTSTVWEEPSDRPVKSYVVAVPTFVHEPPSILTL